MIQNKKPKTNREKMKSLCKKIGIGILSGVTLLLGACHFPRPSFNGPPEDVYGPPAPEIEVDSSADADIDVIEE